MPFASISAKKATIVCGPLKNSWQIEELQELRSRGWTVHYRTSAGFIGSSCKFMSDSEFSLYDGYHVLDDHTSIEEHGSLENEDWITDRTEIQADDDTGIEVACLGFI